MARKGSLPRPLCGSSLLWFWQSWIPLNMQSWDCSKKWLFASRALCENILSGFQYNWISLKRELGKCSKKELFASGPFCQSNLMGFRNNWIVLKGTQEIAATHLVQQFTTNCFQMAISIQRLLGSMASVTYVVLFTWFKMRPLQNSFFSPQINLRTRCIWYLGRSSVIILVDPWDQFIQGSSFWLPIPLGYGHHRFIFWQLGCPLWWSDCEKYLAL